MAGERMPRGWEASVLGGQTIRFQTNADEPVFNIVICCLRYETALVIFGKLCNFGLETGQLA